MNIDNHPCFNVNAHKTHGRVHLPVAPRCNVQCKFCNRKYDCVNESRPGVSSGVLTPRQAMAYLESVFAAKQNISVVGIAGPGDPFANPEETLETLRLVREQYPEVLLCVATNGLNITPYLDDLAGLGLSHVTVTVNAVDPTIGARIYAWVRRNRRVLRGDQGAAVLLENQLSAIVGLKQRGMIVKLNAIILPGVNDGHMEEIAKAAAGLHVDILNCVPYYPSAGSAFEHLAEPSPELVAAIREQAGRHIKQMRHCTRCRADAVGLLGATPDLALMKRIQECERLEISLPAAAGGSWAPHVAVASMEGVLVNQHLGEAERLLIYGWQDGAISLLETRRTPEPGGGDARWAALAETVADCRAVLVSGVGERPRQALSRKGIAIFEIEGVIDDAVQAVMEGRNIAYLKKRSQAACARGCGGTGTGCGA